MAAEQDVWALAYDSNDKTRYIPVELWTGGEWDGTRELRMNPTDLKFGKHKAISGPILFTRSDTSESILVYKRINGEKTQLFTLSSRKDGLGRVFDSRYGRDCKDEVKMPLGLWRDGESRTFTVECNQGELVRKIEITIEKIDFEYKGVPHSLRFHWLADGGWGKATDMHYTYSPGLGLVDVFGNE